MHVLISSYIFSFSAFFLPPHILMLSRQLLLADQTQDLMKRSHGKADSRATYLTLVLGKVSSWAL